MARHDFRPYLGYDQSELLLRLVEVTMELAGLHEELATVMVGERRAKIMGFAHSVETTVSGRERDADLNALDLTCTLFELKAKVQALDEERNLLRLILSERMEG